MDSWIRLTLIHGQWVPVRVYPLAVAAGTEPGRSCTPAGKPFFAPGGSSAPGCGWVRRKGQHGEMEPQDYPARDLD